MPVNTSAVDLDGLLKADLVRVFSERDTATRAAALAELFQSLRFFLDPPGA